MNEFIQINTARCFMSKCQWRWFESGWGLSSKKYCLFVGCDLRVSVTIYFLWLITAYFGYILFVLVFSVVEIHNYVLIQYNGLEFWLKNNPNWYLISLRIVFLKTSSLMYRINTSSKNITGPRIK